MAGIGATAGIASAGAAARADIRIPQPPPQPQVVATRPMGPVELQVAAARVSRQTAERGSLNVLA